MNDDKRYKLIDSKEYLNLNVLQLMQCSQWPKFHARLDMF